MVPPMMLAGAVARSVADDGDDGGGDSPVKSFQFSPVGTRLGEDKLDRERLY